MSFIYKRLPAPWRTQDAFQAGILNLICFPPPPFNKPVVPRLQEKLEAAEDQGCSEPRGAGPQDPRPLQGPRFSPNSQQGNIIPVTSLTGPYKYAPNYVAITPLPLPATPPPPSTTHRVFPTSRQFVFSPRTT